MRFSSAAIVIISAVLAVCQASAIILNKDLGVSCAPITYNAKSKLPATIELYVDLITLEDPDKIKDFKLPVLIFRATDIYNFSNVPSIHEYNQEYYANWADLHDLVVDGDKFKLVVERGYPQEIDTSRLLNSFAVLDTEENSNTPQHVDVIFPVKETGLYCVYIAPPKEGLVELKVPIRYQNSYGLLDFTGYCIYSQYKYLISLGIAIFGYLFYYIVKMVGKDYSSMNSLSVMSKLTVFYLIPPIIMVHIIDWILLGVKNKHIASSIDNKAFDFFEVVLRMVESLFGVYFNAIFLLFAMGYGVIYYHNGSRKYRELPLALLRKVKILFTINAIAICIATFLFTNVLSPMYDPTLMPLFPEMLQQKKRSWLVSIIGSLALSLVLLLPMVWSICSFYYFFQTKKLIAKFPPIQSGNDDDVNERITKSFKRSVIVIVGVPFFIFVVGIFAFGVQSGLSNPEFFAKQYANEEQRLLAIFEYMVIGKRLPKMMFWAQILGYYFTVIIFYFIWVRGNNGLLVDNDPLQEYDEVTRYEVYSDDDSQSQSQNSNSTTA
ncbi:uncharacterized protein KQ657_000657 [Scheffersomyces spartinae]|uniref:Uncharacterized protein n=1 Tax=Scheffersomyces spartinae TaxID=45513 RepID=A0A9P8AHP6_9ASCO|nr:uncharacterized protein KQ657_000657 [Scheffersomyces spartinae]KAG7193587.1 hypothetical protein KQ657_000657 [Scheffersomyces spartinae]